MARLDKVTPAEPRVDEAAEDRCLLEEAVQLLHPATAAVVLTGQLHPVRELRLRCEARAGNVELRERLPATELPRRERDVERTDLRAAGIDLEPIEVVA